MVPQVKSKLTTHTLLTAAIGAIAIAPAFAMGQAQTRTWLGEIDSNWNNSNNWSTGGAPLASDRIAVFSEAATHQPAIHTHVTVIGGIWMTGDTVGDVIITSDPAGQNNGAPTFQTRGNTINEIAGLGILIDNTSSGALTINTSAFKVEFNQTWINNSDNLFTLAANTNLAGATVTVDGSGDTLISGNLTNNGGTGRLTKNGSGTLTLTNATISYNGNTTLNDGTLLVNGVMSSSNALVTVNGGTLGGTGTINRATTINEGGTIAPGAASDVAGGLTVNRNLTLNGTAAFDLIDAGDHDVLLFNATDDNSRTLTFGGDLVVSAHPDLSFAAGQVFDLFDWGSRTTVTGTFDSIQLPTLSGGLSWKVFGDQPFDYSTGEIAVVPEPMGLSALALAATGLLARRRRRA